MPAQPKWRLFIARWGRAASGVYETKPIYLSKINERGRLAYTILAD
jgi:hypothetical protein